jgi:CHAD domain-containing protein
LSHKAATAGRAGIAVHAREQLLGRDQRSRLYELIQQRFETFRLVPNFNGIVPLVARYPIDRYNVSIMDSGYRLLAAKYVRRQAKQLAEQFDGVRAAEDIEFVHRARVATRRLRAALRMFDDCFARKQLRRWRKAIRRTTAKLGNARDRDVQIELLCGALSALSTKECFPGISRILVQLERDRERLQRKVVKAMDRLEAKGVLRQIQRVTKRILRKAAGDPGTDSEPASDDSTSVTRQNVQTPVAYAQTRRHILRHLDEVLRHQDSLANPDERERHHAMRIATKRLRYTVEIARPVYPGRLDEAVEAIKRVQSLLGDVHDCDVWVEHLDAFASQQRERITALFGHAGRFARLQAGIDYLRQDRRQHRQEVFGQLREYWEELGRRQFWEGLTSAVLAQGKLPVMATPRPSGNGSATVTPTSEPTAAPVPDAPVAPTGEPSVAAPMCQQQPAPGNLETRPLIDGSSSVLPATRRTLLTAGS